MCDSASKFGIAIKREGGAIAVALPRVDPSAIQWVYHVVGITATVDLLATPLSD
jgi:hypothetical protein